MIAFYNVTNSYIVNNRYAKLMHPIAAQPEHCAAAYTSHSQIKTNHVIAEIGRKQKAER